MQDASLTIYIGHLPDGLSDIWIERLLKACGTLQKWHRPPTTHKPKPFGFATFTDLKSLGSCLRILGGEVWDGFEFCSPFGGAVEVVGPLTGDRRRLVVTCEEGVRRKCKSLPPSPDLDQQQFEQVDDILRHMYKQVDIKPPKDIVTKKEIEQEEEEGNISIPSGLGIPLTGYEIPDGEDPNELPSTMPREQRELLQGEINYFRNKVAEKEKEREVRFEREKVERERFEQRQYYAKKRLAVQAVRERQGDSNGDGFAVVGLEFTPASGSGVFGDGCDLWEEVYSFSNEERLRRLTQTLEEREQKWTYREETRSQRLLQDSQKEREWNNKRLGERDYWLKRLSTFDDDQEFTRAYTVDEKSAAYQPPHQREITEFFRDRMRWWGRRKHFRNKELDGDEMDYRMEMSEVRKSEGFRSDGEKGAVKKERKEDEGEGEGKEEEEDITDDTNVVGRIMTASERKALMQQIIDAIPTEKDDIWKWEVKWDSMDESILVNKLRPFITKKVVEYLGEEEGDLIEFVVDKLKERVDVGKLLEELEMALDEEAEVFVVKLWRMLIYETEARAKGL